MDLFRIGRRKLGFRLPLEFNDLCRQTWQCVQAPCESSDQIRASLRVCEALAFAHDRGVLYCNVKPANIMMGDYGEVHLIDWGVARVILNDEAYRTDQAISEPGLSWNLVAVPELTNDAAVCAGIPGYTSPEKILQQDLTTVTDVFCLGGVPYEILTRTAPCSGLSMENAMARAQKAKFVPPDEVVGSGTVAPGLRRIVMTAMASNPTDRCSSAEELKQELLRFTQGDGAFERETFSAGTVIVADGNSGNCAYIIESGQCEACRSLQGDRVTPGRLGPGDIFGEMAVLSPGPRTANVAAVEDVVVSQVVHDDVLERELDALRPWVRLTVRRLADRLREDGMPRRGLRINKAHIARHVTMYLCTWSRRGAMSSLSCEMGAIARHMAPRLDTDLAGIEAALREFPGSYLHAGPCRLNC